MRIGVCKETKSNTPLVSGTPDTVAKLIKLGYEVVVEAHAGQAASYFDDQYEAAGAKIVDTEELWESDIVTCIDTPSPENLSRMGTGKTLIARLAPNMHPELVDTLSKGGLTALALDMVPRISRAQSMDVRSSMMNVAGYRAVIEAAENYGKTFAGQITAAGKVAPAKVYVIGVGVAGLAAIGQAGSMGAQVFATDVRSDVADQVESLGATFVEIPVSQESSDGYAKALTEDQQNQVLKVYTEQASKCDIVITTAQVPGRPAPLLITAQAVANMKPGSVIVDMGASELGGNCELTRPNEVFVTENGVTIIGYTDLASRMPGQSSQLFGQNIVNLLKLATPGKDGNLVLDEEDDVIRGMTVTLNGDVMWPPPAISVSVAPSGKKEEAPTQKSSTQKSSTQKTKSEESTPLNGLWWKMLLGIIACALIMLAPASMRSHFIVFALACVVGFYVITGVSHTLHTPLMSVTNAISGIIIVGAILQIGSDNPLVIALSFIAMVIASVNIFGGFLVTRRMLGMFERSSEE